MATLTHVVAIVVAISGSAAADTGERLCETPSSVAEDDAHAGMVWIEGGTFTTGSAEHHPEERAPHLVTVEGFWIDRNEVTNAQFARFAEETGYRTLAERGLDPAKYPGMPPELLVPGSMVFFLPERIANMADITQWWRYQPGADWRQTPMTPLDWAGAATGFGVALALLGVFAAGCAPSGHSPARHDGGADPVSNGVAGPATIGSRAEDGAIAPLPPRIVPAAAEASPETVPAPA